MKILVALLASLTVAPAAEALTWKEFWEPFVEYGNHYHHHTHRYYAPHRYEGPRRCMEERIIKEYILEKNEFRDYFENLQTKKNFTAESIFIQNVENYLNNLEIEHLDNFLHKDWLLKFGESIGFQEIKFKPNAFG